MIGKPLQVDMMPGFLQHPCFAHTGQSGDTDQAQIAHRDFELIDKEATHGFESALDQRVVNALLAQPLLCGART